MRDGRIGRQALAADPLLVGAGALADQPELDTVKPGRGVVTGTG